MIKIIEKFLTENFLKKEDIFNPYLNADLKNYLDNYYRIILPSTLNNMTDLETQIYELVSPRSIMFHYFHDHNYQMYFCSIYL